MIELPSDQRKHWDNIVDPFLKYILVPGTPPSQSGLAYALSKMVWGLFNAYPTWTVAVGLRAVLREVHDEFQFACLENGLQPSPTLKAGTTVGHSQSQPVNIQQIPKKATTINPAPDGTLPAGFKYMHVPQPDGGMKTKIIKLQDLQDTIAKGFTGDLFDAVPGQVVHGTEDPKAFEVVEDSASEVVPGVTMPPKAEQPITIIDPNAEADAQAAYILALKAYSIATQAKAKPEKLRELQDRALNLLSQYMKVLGAQ